MSIKTRSKSLRTGKAAVEVFASDGLTYMPMPVIAKVENLSLEVYAKGGEAKFKTLSVHELESAWPAK